MTVRYENREYQLFQHYLIASDQQLTAEDAKEEFGIDSAVKVLESKVEIKRTYLVEFPNGERRWLNWGVQS